jgi:NAD+ diphosphatase
MSGVQDRGPVRHAFAGGNLDRRAELRRVRGPRLIIKLAGDRAVVREGAEGALKLALFGEEAGPQAVHLGVQEDGTHIMAERLIEGALPEACQLIDLRSLAMQGLIGTAELALLAQARSLLFWNERHGFCANCGAVTVLADGGYRRDCPACKAQHFPRTDPVVIMTVSGPEGVMLGRGHGFLPGVYSALAGFMEPGESIEEAAMREIFEETGIRAHRVRYHSSQPWPFPSSLMIGLLAWCDGGCIRIDVSELEDARWFTRPELLAMLAGTHDGGLKVPRPAAIAHHLIRAAAEGISDSSP